MPCYKSINLLDHFFEGFVIYEKDIMHLVEGLWDSMVWVNQYLAYVSHQFKRSLKGCSPLNINSAHMMFLMPWSYLCVKPPRMSNVRQI